MPQLSILLKPASSMCNMRCKYCFYVDEAKHRKTASYGMMSEDTLENLVRKAFAYADMQVSFAFQGGEPTLVGKEYFRIFLALLEKYNTRKINVINAIQTNGMYIDSEWCALFREGNFLVGLSLDGTETLHDEIRQTPDGRGTFEKITQSAALLKKEQIEFNILAVVTETASKHAAEMFHSLKVYRYLQFIPCLDDLEFRSPYSVSAASYGQFLIDMFDLYEVSMRSGHPVSIRNFDNWVGMSAGYPPENCALSGRCGNYYLIEADGTVFPCDFYALDQWKLGNINSDSFFRLAKAPLVKEFVLNSVMLSDTCKQCKWLFLCRGGCKRDREPIMNGIPSENRLCIGHRIFFEARYRKIAALAEYLKDKRTKI